MLALTLIAKTTFAQGPDFERNERIEAMKVSFITDQLKLTPEEAKAFWPIFNQFETEKRALREEFRNNHGPNQKNIDEISEAEAEKMINNEISFLQKDLDIMKRYIAQFKSVLPTKKVAVLLSLENKFKRMILDRIKKGEGSPPPPR